MTTLASLTAVGSVLVLGACGGGGTSSAAASTRSADREAAQAVKFAQCMRQHGIDMPDPQVTNNGRDFSVQFRVGTGSNKPDDAKMQAAQNGCKQFMPNGGRPPSAADQQRMLDQATKFAECMRSHGVDFPDPQVSSNGAVEIGGGPSNSGNAPTFNKDDPRVQQAQAACQHLLPGAGGGGLRAYSGTAGQ